jgi:ribosomal protein S18 acetylase RimI-like enzyme
MRELDPVKTPPSESPEKPDAPAMARRPARKGDWDFLLVLYASTRKEEMERVNWSEEQKQSFLESQLAAQKAAYEERFPDSEHEIILVKKKPIGRIWVNRSEEEIRLLDIALLPEYRRRGIGTALLRGLQQEAAAGEKPLRHCVYITNHPAVAFYRKLGFEVIEDLGMYYLMEWDDAEETQEKDE